MEAAAVIERVERVTATRADAAAGPAEIEAASGGRLGRALTYYELYLAVTLVSA
ncbi:MAG: hypothetical protein ACR2O6_06480 [Ilumatobacteraceae bacterium]